MKQTKGKRWDPYSSKFTQKVVPYWKRESNFLKNVQNSKSFYKTKTGQFRKSFGSLNSEITK